MPFAVPRERGAPEAMDPYGQQNPYGAPQHNPYAQPQQPNPYAQQPNPYGAPPQHPYGAPPPPQPFGGPQPFQPGVAPQHPYAPPVAANPYATPQQSPYGGAPPAFFPGGVAPPRPLYAPQGAMPPRPGLAPPQPGLMPPPYAPQLVPAPPSPYGAAPPFFPGAAAPPPPAVVNPYADVGKAWSDLAAYQDDQATLCPGRFNCGATVCAFDDGKELVWIGRADGRLRALTTDSLRTYCACVAHPDDAAVKALAPLDRAVATASAKWVRLHSKGGVLKLEKPAAFVAGGKDDPGPLRCLAAADATVAVGGAFGAVAILDAARGYDATRRYHDVGGSTGALASGSGAAFGGAHRSVFLAGGGDGVLRVLDARTKGVVATMEGPGGACGALFDVRSAGSTAVALSVGGVGGPEGLKALDAAREEVALAWGKHGVAAPYDPQLSCARPRYELLVKAWDLRLGHGRQPLLCSRLDGAPCAVALARRSVVDTEELVLAGSKRPSLVACDGRGDASDARHLGLTFPEHGRAPLTALAASPSGELLCVCDAAGGTKLLSLSEAARAGDAARGADTSAVVVPPPLGPSPVKIDASPDGRSFGPNGASSPAACMLLLPTNAHESLRCPKNGDASKVPKPIPNRDTISEKWFGEGGVLDRAGKLHPPQIMAEDEELSSKTSPWNAAAFAAALEPRGGDNYTRRRVSKEITESKELRKDGALVGVPNKWGFKPNGLLYDDDAAKVCFDVVDPRVVRSKRELQAQERLAAAAERGADVPHKYAKHVIDVSRRGVDGFDFSRYNRTPFGGLENALGDARFTNAALLLLYFLPELRSLVLADQYEPTAKNVLPSAPPAANFVLELSFLFQVLDLAPRQPAHKRACHSANALSALTLVPDAVALGLVQKAGAAAEAPAGERKRRPLARKALVFHRFALEQLAAHLADGARVQRLLGFTSATENAFLDGGDEGRTRTTCALTTDLLLDRPFHHAPTPALARDENGRIAADDDVQEPWRFCDALRASLVRETRARAWRESTKRYEPIAQRRTPRPDLPELLAFHCVADADDATTDGAWASDGDPWVAAAFDLEVDGGGRCRVFEGAAGCGDAELDAATVDAATYELVGVLSHVDRGGDALQTDADATVGEMEALEGVVAHARAAASYFTRAAEEQAKPASFAAKLAIERDRQSSPSRRDRPKSVLSPDERDRHELRRSRSPPRSAAAPAWVFVNDFLLETSTLDDALKFPATPRRWRTPCALYYARKRDAVDEPAPSADDHPCVPALVLGLPPENSASKASRRRPRQKEKKAAAVEFPGAGGIVALDSEYVSVESADTSVRRDGSRVTTSLGRMSLARLSVVDGDERVLFDDYVLQTETVVDYNTRFSGVAAEDLDPATSKHDLYRRAVVCMKLRRLVDAGCVLVGHSLQSDFRVMNVAVPPDQVIDTAQLFSRPGERKISLRFLCSYLLDHVIQDDNHDSVEDARAALRLYRLYQKLKAEGTLRETLGRVYDHGRKTEWTIVAPKAELRADAAEFGADGDAADAPPDVAGLTVSAPPDEPQPPGTAAPPS